MRKICEIMYDTLQTEQDSGLSFLKMNRTYARSTRVQCKCCK